jgi:hypothetical protein
MTPPPRSAAPRAPLGPRTASAAALLLWPLLVAAVPPVTLGPDDGARAPRATAPITKVTVFEERARVLRRGVIEVPAGASTWRLPDLPGLTELATVRATVTGPARLLRLEASPVDREKLALEPAAALLDALDAKDDELRRVDLERRTLDARAKLWASLAPAASVDEARREGRPAPGMFADAWLRVATVLTAERGVLLTKVQALDVERRRLVEARAELAAQLSRLDLGGLTERVVSVVAVLDAAGPGRATVELEYFVPGARWRPAYELRFLADDGRADLAQYGLVTQASGEDWTDVELELSTAQPSVGIALPTLLTWTLGEAKEWRPVVYPRSGPPAVPVFPPPTPSTSKSETARDVERALLLARIQGLGAVGAPAPEPSMAKDANDYGATTRATAGMAYRPAPRSSVPPPPPPPPPMAPMAPSPRSYAYAEAEESSVMKSAEAVPIAMADSVSSAAPGSVARAFALFEAPMSRPRPVDPSSPAALAGGLSYVYAAAARATVRSTGDAYRAPLARETHPVTAYYEATPALAPQAFLRATVTNRSSRPILGGPVGIFLGTAYAGDGALATTGAGGNLALPLGADEDVRVSRKLLLDTTSKGVFSKEDVTTYRVVLEVASYKKKSVRVVVREPLPMSGGEDVEVKLLSATPKAAAPDEDGIVEWTVDVAPGKVAKLELAYQVVRPADFQLYQR